MTMSTDYDEVDGGTEFDADETENSHEDPSDYQSTSNTPDESSSASAASEEAESGDVVEDGFDVATHGGGSLEFAPGFAPDYALTEGFQPEVVPIDPRLNGLPRSCDLEYGDVPESVCGRDDRVHVTAVTNIPWRMICQLIITRRDGGRSRCTGWFIAPRTVMTAGHCVYSHTGGGWPKQIEVIPGMNAALRPFGSAVGTSFHSVKGWTDGKKPTHDYGCILLPKSQPLGSKTGWFGFGALSTKSLRRLLVNNSGYPGDKAFGTQWYNAGRITKVMARRLQYMIDTAGGQSGSPTWRYKNGKRHAVGVHAYGGCPNKSTRIIRPVFDNMKSWKSKGM